MDLGFTSKVPDLSFDVSALLEAYRWISTRVQPVVADRGEDKLRSLSLTHRPGAVEPLYDGNISQFYDNGNLRYQESDFSIFNKDFRQTYFYEVYRQMPFSIGRMRLMVLPPLTIYQMHRDATKRAHIAIITNPDARIISRTGESAHIPVDGNVYVIDTKREHTAYNSGLMDRIHLTMSMSTTSG